MSWIDEELEEEELEEEGEIPQSPEEITHGFVMGGTKPPNVYCETEDPRTCQDPEHHPCTGCGICIFPDHRQLCGKYACDNAGVGYSSWNDANGPGESAPLPTSLPPRRKKKKPKKEVLVQPMAPPGLQMPTRLPPAMDPRLRMKGFDPSLLARLEAKMDQPIAGGLLEDLVIGDVSRFVEALDPTEPQNDYRVRTREQWEQMAEKKLFLRGIMDMLPSRKDVDVLIEKDRQERAQINQDLQIWAYSLPTRHPSMVSPILLTVPTDPDVDILGPEEIGMPPPPPLPLPVPRLRRRPRRRRERPGTIEVPLGVEVPLTEKELQKTRAQIGIPPDLVPKRRLPRGPPATFPPFLPETPVPSKHIAPFRATYWRFRGMYTNDGSVPIDVVNSATLIYFLYQDLVHPAQGMTNLSHELIDLARSHYGPAHLNMEIPTDEFALLDLHKTTPYLRMMDILPNMDYLWRDPLVRPVARTRKRWRGQGAFPEAAATSAIPTTEGGGPRPSKRRKLE